jgi:deoxycytidylate deaminase
MTQLLLYAPVIHNGHVLFFDKYGGADVEVLLIGRSFAEDHPVVRKEIRALDPELILVSLRAMGLATRGRVVERGDLPAAIRPGRLVVPDEDLTRQLVEEHQLDTIADVEYVRTFLRWDREWSRAGRPPEWDGAVAVDEYARQMQDLATRSADLSSDWWRQVGAVAVRDGVVLAAGFNRHLPSEYSPYVDGDPRNDFRRGVEMERTTSIHAEAAIVTRAAREGFSLRGADLHVGTFPCPGCARLVAEAGFARCFFAGGYSLLNGDEVMRAAGMKLIWVGAG